MPRPWSATTLLFLSASCFLSPGLSAQGACDDDPPGGSRGELLRLLAGLQQSAASSAPGVQRPFLDAYVSVPLSDGGALRSWGDIRATSVAQQINSSVREFVAEDGLTTTLGDVPVSKLVQGLGLRAGVELRLGAVDDCRDGFASESKQRFTTHLIVGFGLLTPNVPEEALRIYHRSDSAALRYELTDDEAFIAFASPRRNRFLREYFVGLRLQTHYFEGDGSKSNRFPAMLDITVGQDEAVSGGKLVGPVLGLDGFIPLPWKVARSVHIFGSAKFALRNAEISRALILKPAPADTEVPAPNVRVIDDPLVSTDTYRVGVAINLLDLIETFRDPK